MAGVNWSAWKLDGWTISWIVWIVAFFVLETVALVTRSHNELTEHLRPALQVDPLTWFLALGVWLWLGWHFLIQGYLVKT